MMTTENSTGIMYYNIILVAVSIRLWEYAYLNPIVLLIDPASRQFAVVVRHGNIATIEKII